MTHIEALTKTIMVQQELIDFLKKEIAKLQCSPTPGCIGNQPHYIGYSLSPYVTPNNPLTPLYVVNCDGQGNAKIDSTYTINGGLTGNSLSGSVTLD